MPSQGGAVRIAGGAAFWGDSMSSLEPLVRNPGIDYLLLEYLAEITMALLARARAKSQDAGYVPDFVAAMERYLPDIARNGIKVVTNAGGVNPRCCAAALRQVAEKLGLLLKIAVVEGDDLLHRADELRASGIGAWRTGEPLPPSDPLQSINVYLGATPIAAALRAGADVVITGRCVDSALALGPLMHEFNWRADQYDLLAAGSVCGHLIECGAQSTGGNFTDWREIEGWDDMGYPIAECYPDGTFVLTKPPATGGAVTVATVVEQLLYEVDDPANYLLPDVTVDFRRVELRQEAKDRVVVTGARGRPPSRYYKATVTHAAGFRCVAVFMIGGIDAAEKGRKVADAVLSRCRRIFRGGNLGDFQEVDVEVLGAEATYGPHARAGSTREVMVKIGVKHPERRALQIFAAEIAPTSTCMAPGIAGFYAGRPAVAPVFAGISALVPKSLVSVRALLDGQPIELPPVEINPVDVPPDDLAPLAAGKVTDAAVAVPLVKLAHARSGDKGDDALIGVIARKSEYLPYIASALTPATVTDYFGHVVEGAVRRFDVPGVGAFIFELRNALGGGGINSLRIDPQGKAYGQMLLDAEIPVPSEWADRFN